MSAPADHRETVRRGRRRGGRLVVVHLLAGAEPVVGPSRAGLVVARTVGPAVTRNRVKRRLRHLLRERLDGLPGGSLVVVRAQPRAAQASYAELADELDRCLADLTAAANSVSVVS